MWQKLVKELTSALAQRSEQSDEQPGHSGATRNVQKGDSKNTLSEERSQPVSNNEVIRKIKESPESCEIHSDVQVDSDSEDLSLALKLSTMMYSRRDSDSDDEEMLMAKQLSMGMDLESSRTEIDEVNQQSECQICTEASDNMLSYGCPHYYCRNCVKTNLETSINEGQIDSFICPEPKCDIRASENFVKMVVSTTFFNRYETLMIKKVVDDMDDIVYCPIVECGAINETDGSGTTQCWQCSRLLCTLCCKLYHGHTDCELTEDERTDNLRRIRDEEVAEKILLAESQDQLMIEELERENEEWLRIMREEQAEIRRMEQIEQEEDKKGQEEARIKEQAAKQLEEERRRKEDRRREEEYHKLVQENVEWEKLQQQKLEMRRKADEASEDTVRKTTKKCPHCKSPIEKNDGCIHMTCIKCTHEFCWGCRKVWSHDHICVKSIFSRYYSKHLSSSPYCRGFDTQPETAKHFLCFCPRLANLRVKCLGDYYLTPEEIREAPLSNILSFAESSGWLDWSL